jgi:hypothetical protein
MQKVEWPLIFAETKAVETHPEDSESLGKVELPGYAI